MTFSFKSNPRKYYSFVYFINKILKNNIIFGIKKIIIRFKIMIKNKM